LPRGLEIRLVNCIYGLTGPHGSLAIEMLPPPPPKKKKKKNDNNRIDPEGERKSLHVGPPFHPAVL